MLSLPNGHIPARMTMAVGTVPDSRLGASPQGRLAPRPGALFCRSHGRHLRVPHTTLIFVNECGWRSLKGHRVASGAIASDYGDGPQGNVGVGSAGYSGRGRRSLDSLPALSCLAARELTQRDHQRGYLPVTPGTLASGRACIGRLSSSFLAPQTLQTRWLATSGTGSRFGNPSDSGSI
jgi:hypothetical protein